MYFAAIDDSLIPVLVPGPDTFTLADAVRRFGRTEADLRRVWTATFGFLYEPADHVPSTAPAEPAPDTLSQHLRAKLPADAIRTLVAAMYPDLAPEFVDLHIAFCQRKGVDPLSRLLVPRVEVLREGDESARMSLVHITTIAYMRAVAARHPEFNGELPAEYCDEDGTWADVILGGKTAYAIRAPVQRKGRPAPFAPVLFRQELEMMIGQRIPRTPAAGPMYFQTCPNAWMMKCAYVASYRAAFGDLFDGMYLADEMRRAPLSPAGPQALSPEEADALADEVDASMAPENEAELHAALRRMGFHEFARSAALAHVRKRKPLLEERSFEAFAEEVVNAARRGVRSPVAV